MTPTAGGRPDVVVVGDGPAGAAAAHACAEAGLLTELLGTGDAWTSTYAAWVDEVPSLPGHVWESRSEHTIVGGDELRRIDRSYGVFDNAALREHLRGDRVRVDRAVATVGWSDRAEVELASGAQIVARWVIDARGAPPTPPAAWQTAYGVVVDRSAAERVGSIDAPTVMDWSWSGVIDTPSFLYMIPRPEGWLVEHTVLAATERVEPDALRPALVDRLGAAAVVDAERRGAIERVRIPMGVRADPGCGRVVRFGAAAGMGHPATGFSVAGSLAAAPRLAAAITDGAHVGAVAESVWPRSARCVRACHDYGLDVLLGLDASESAAFFGAFFALPPETWGPYLRIDATPFEIARAMSAVFSRVPWPVRRRLLGGDRGLLRGVLGR